MDSQTRYVLMDEDEEKPQVEIQNENAGIENSETVFSGEDETLSSKYESLNYEIFENFGYINEMHLKGYKFILWKNISRWMIFCLIGFLTALTASFVHIAIKELSTLKFSLLSLSFEVNFSKGLLILPFTLWCLFNLLLTLIGATLVTLFAPVASGSGIPQVKSYLNGVNVPKIVRIKTLIVKVIGVICSVVGGLACGKEGPMIHTGAVIAAGVSQGKSTSFNTDFKVLKYFREDHEKRDFVSGGAASGVAAAFGAPVGGVLFSLEEGASFWNQFLTWKTFFASAISFFTLNTVLSAYYNVPGKLSYPGLLNLGKSETSDYELFEFPMYLLMGVFGGMTGAFWIFMNHKLACFRNKYIQSPILKILEACFVAVLSAAIAFIMIVISDDCQAKSINHSDYSVQLNCPPGQVKSMSSLWFDTPEASVKSLFHSPIQVNPKCILAFVITYYFLSCLTFGLSVSSGVFIPTLLTGAAWGRLVPVALSKLGIHINQNVGKYALIGGAAQLGGVVRMTLSLTVILIEATGDVSLALPFILTLIAAKWTGDFFNEGVYDMYIRLSGIPLLNWSAPPLTHNVYASEIMSRPVITLNQTEKVSHLLHLLKTTTHNGFPIIDSLKVENSSQRKLRGLILRSQIIVLLKYKIFNEMADIWKGNEKIDIFRNEYPRYPTIHDIIILNEEMDYTIDMRPFMNPAPYTITHSATLPRIFQLFRALGLRHLPVISDNNEVVGIITRKDLARYRVGFCNDLKVFGQESIDFLVYHVTKDELSPLKEKVEAIDKLLVPQAVCELKRFLGLVNFYHRFLPECATLQQPLNEKFRSSNRLDCENQSWIKKKIKLNQEIKLN